MTIQAICLIVLFLFVYNRAEAAMRFISVENGLSNSSVHGFFQDKRNHLWITADYGLNRLTGADIKVFNQSFQDKCSLPNNYTTCVYEDSHNNFWVGTLNGLYKYNYLTETFISCFTREYPSASYAKVSCIVEDNSQRVWISLAGEGLLCVKLADHTVSLFDTPEIKNMDITTMLLGDNGEIWIGSKYSGVAVFHPDTRTLENINALYPSNQALDKNSIFSLSKGANGNILVPSLGAGIFSIDRQTHQVNALTRLANNPAARLAHCIIKDKQNRIWIGTDGGGLWLLDEEKETLTPYNIQNFGFNPMIGKVQSLYEDKQGNIWVSYVEKGVIVISAEEEGFGNIENNPYSGLNITDQSVVSVLMDKKQELWIGTNGSGLYKLTYTGGQYQVQEQVLPEENVITTLFQDSRGLIYIGTYLHGFYIYNPSTGTYKNYRHRTGESNSVNCNHIIQFIEDEDHILWIATNGGGVNRMNPSTEAFTYFQQKSNGLDNYLVSNWCNCLYIYQNILWIGTYAGITCLDLDTYETSLLTRDNQSISNNAVVAITGDADGNIWIGTNWGLDKMEKETKKTILYTTENGLPDNVITGFQKDQSGKIWVSTNNGIARYLAEKDKFIGYGSYDGINNHEFKPRASAIGNTGNLYFGGTNGVTWFNPEKLETNEPLTGVMLSDFSLFNEKTRIGEAYERNVILKQTLQETERITLNYQQNNFSIRFDALEFTVPDRIRYEYKLEGLDKNWQSNQRGNRTAVYTNVSPGVYTFLVKAYTTPENLQTTQLTIHILPPWWFSWWAKVVYVLLFLLSLYATYRIIVARIREKQRMLEKEHNELLAQSKLQFFTDISHEIRTPLTLVISPLLKLMLEDTDPERLSVYRIMHRNATRILRLVNQLLDIRKIDRKQMRLSVRETDVVSFINDIVDSFTPLSVDKNIRLQLTSGQVPDTAWIDIDFIDKIVYNLLSNAFKFTPKGGAIEVSMILTGEDKLQIAVRDNGKGISPEYIQNIFERFYQVHQRGNSGSMGTGIGLHLSKMLSELHHGSMDVLSIPDQGSIFTVTIPYHPSDYLPDEITDIPVEYTGSTSIESMGVLIDEVQEETESAGTPSPSSRKPTILLVEDHPEIRALLRKELQQRFHLLEAEDGKKGYELATVHLPDLIITDVMMPVMDGFEMTQRIRANSHIRLTPIIMLTAKTAPNDNVAGLEAGADVYIAKPFDLRYLQANIVNLLNKQALSQARYATDPAIETDGFDIKSADDRLMEKLNRIIKEHISDSSLSIESLSSELGISRVHLHRKLKELCKQTPSIYLRNIRLEHAAHLLRSKKISIAEVAYAIGFNSHQYFSNCFKDFYGVSPAEYASLSKSQLPATK